MKMKIFTVRDAKAEAFITPFFLPNTAMAERTFSDCINSDSHQFGQNPEDYSLWLLGEFDMNAGTVESHEPEIINNGFAYVRSATDAPQPKPSLSNGEPI